MPTATEIQQTNMPWCYFSRQTGRNLASLTLSQADVAGNAS